uniref:Glabrous enhancer-binding protein-like DBD domain-containing protein n=1 Tax=Anthurium amnicola TaxID=1678845 RepID=A0A1D1YFB2_9ARAE
MVQRQRGGDVDDEEEEEETDDMEEDDDDDEEDDDDVEQKKPLAGVASVADLNGFSSPSTSSASDPTAKIPNPNGTPSPVPVGANPSLNGPTSSASAPAAAATPVQAAVAPPDRKRPRPDPGSVPVPVPVLVPAASASALALALAEEKKPLAVLEDSRRLFQRLFTDEDEIAILQGFLDFTSQRSAATSHHAHHHDTGPFYDQIRTRLQLDFNKNQLVEKLRRLKKKYRNIVNKMGSGKDYAFKSPHDHATFDLSRKIWGSNLYSRGAGACPDDDEDDDPTPHPQIGGNGDCGGVGPAASMMTSSDRRRSRRRGRRRSLVAAAAAAEALLMTPEAPVEVKVAESHMPTAMASVPNVIEETVRSCLSPLFKEMLCYAVGGPIGPGAASAGGFAGLGLSPLSLNAGSNPGNAPNAAALDDKWRKQQILELEVYSKRLELVQEQIKLMLEELRK